MNVELCVMPHAQNTSKFPAQKQSESRARAATYCNARWCLRWIDRFRSCRRVVTRRLNFAQNFCRGILSSVEILRQHTEAHSVHGCRRIDSDQEGRSDDGHSACRRAYLYWTGGGHFPWSPSRSLASRADTQSFELHPAAADD